MVFLKSIGVFFGFVTAAMISIWLFFMIAVTAPFLIVIIIAAIFAVSYYQEKQKDKSNKDKGA